MGLLMYSVCFYLLIGFVYCDRCSFEYACTCGNETINCEEEELFVMPVFTHYERRNIRVLNMMKTRLKVVPKMSRNDWPYLHVSVCSFNLLV